MSTFSPLPVHPVLYKTAKWQGVGKDLHTYLFPGSRIHFRRLQIISCISILPFTFSFISAVLCEAE